MGAIIFFSVLIICLSILIFLVEDRSDSFLVGIFWGAALVGLVVSIIDLTIKKKEVSLKNESVKIEIRETVVNGQITDSDTVYVFTPKKK